MEYIVRKVAYVNLECKECKKENAVICDEKTNKEQDEFGEVYIDFRCHSCNTENVRHINLDNDL